MTPAFSKVLLIIATCFFTVTSAIAQTYENEYRQSLDSVLKTIELRYNVKLNYHADVTKDKSVTYAGWRLQSNITATLTKILPLYDLVSYKVNDSVYNIEPFAYWKKPVEEGEAQLNALKALYPTLQQWQQRKADLRQCITTTLGLNKLPAQRAHSVITTGKRIKAGYSVQNIAIQTLPGLYVCGAIYKPLHAKGKLPVVLSPNGHFAGGRYRSDVQYRCAMLAKMGALVITYDLFGWGESRLQVNDADHYTSTAMQVQVINNFRILDYVSILEDADTSRIAITGASGGGSQTMLFTALTDKIKVSVPVVMLSCYFSGGCPCETGLPIHFCGGGTNNAEIAAMASPRPQLIVSDGNDWTAQVPYIEFPYLQQVYGLYNKRENVKNIHLPEEKHDYGFSKRKAMYEFLARWLNLSLKNITNSAGNIDESGCTIENEKALLVFGEKGERLPVTALKGLGAVQEMLKATLQ